MSSVPTTLLSVVCSHLVVTFANANHQGLRGPLAFRVQDTVTFPIGSHVNVLSDYKKT